jgi:hypothetical protein
VLVVRVERHPRRRRGQLRSRFGAQPPIVRTGPSRTVVVDEAIRSGSPPR